MAAPTPTPGSAQAVTEEAVVEAAAVEEAAVVVEEAAAVVEEAAAEAIRTPAPREAEEETAEARATAVARGLRR
ncbi:MAG TPA: hypothetical protein VG496_18420 [Myxococcales bacterium]|nr:hypothetical protein [Myxococcales bacterium]